MGTIWHLRISQFLLCIHLYIIKYKRIIRLFYANFIRTQERETKKILQVDFWKHKQGFIDSCNQSFKLVKLTCYIIAYDTKAKSFTPLVNLEIHW